MSVRGFPAALARRRRWTGVGGPHRLGASHGLGMTLPTLSVMGEPQAEDRLTHLVKALQPLRPVRILLFGSAARGTADDYSDLDVIVVAREVAPRFLDRLAQAYDLIDPRYALDILVYTPEEYAQMRAEENPLVEAAERHGRVLYAQPAG